MIDRSGGDGTRDSPPSRWDRAIQRRDALTLEDAAGRFSAYVYGNILVLAALTALSTEQVEEGHGCVIVLGTALSTYIAHAVSEVVGHSVGPGADDSVESRAAMRHELRNAVPTATSGSIPAILLALGWADGVEPRTALLLAMIWVVLRLGLMGAVIQRLGGERSPVRVLLAGVGLAAVAAAIAVLKLLTTH